MERHNLHSKNLSGGRRLSLRKLPPLLVLSLFFLSDLISVSPSAAQDIHFSQIDVNPILFNPAYSGFFDGNGRFGLSYRNQWASVSRAFQTMAATAELSLMRRRYWRDGLNIGLILYSDRAGSLNYGSTAGNLILSYYKALGSSNNNFVSVALETGFGQAGFNTSDIMMVDPDVIDATSANFFTIGTGLAWFYQPNDDLYIKLGAAARNLNRPDISYLGTEDAFIERKFSGYARAEYRAWPFVSLMPLAACMIQNNYHETLFGCDAKWYVSESSSRQLAFSAGIHYRWRDAALIEFITEYNALLLALSYDANISKLTPASKSFGSFEITLVYRLVHSKRLTRKAMPCPII